MALIPHLIFALLALGSFSFLAVNLRRIWGTIHVGVGVDDVRTNRVFERVFGMLKGGFLQPKMLKDIWPAIMHYMIFFGFVTVSVGTLETLVHGIFEAFSFQLILGNGGIYSFYLASQDIANFVVAIAIGAAFVRRLVFKPWRLSQLEKKLPRRCLHRSWVYTRACCDLFDLHGGKTFIEGGQGLPAGPLLFSRFFGGGVGRLFGVSSTEGWEILSKTFWWAHCLVLFSFMMFLPSSKHQHFIWVWPNMFLRSLTARGRLKSLEFDENAESFGIGKVKDFSWKQLLDGITCVECGRCTEQCPATTTGKPLDPRLIMKHLKVAVAEVSKGVPEDQRTPLIGEQGAIVTPEELWSCTTCGACMEACPLYIEHIPAIVGMRLIFDPHRGGFSR